MTTQIKVYSSSTQRHRAHAHHHPCLTKKKSRTNVSITTRIWVALPSSTCTCHLKPGKPQSHQSRGTPMHIIWSECMYVYIYIYIYISVFIYEYIYIWLSFKYTKKGPLTLLLCSGVWLCSDPPMQQGHCCTQGRAKQRGLLERLFIDTS